MTFDDDRLDDDVASLLRGETADASLPAARVTRARERLELRLGLGATGAAIGAAAATSDAASPPDGADLVAPQAATVGRVAVAAASGVTRGVLGVVAAATFVAGIATGWVASRAQAPAPTDATATPVGIPTTPAPSPPPANVAPTEPPVASASPSSATPASSTSAGRASAPPASVDAHSIAVDASKEERALLDQARRALNEGDGGRALSLVEAHAKRFPRGSLAEERDVLRVQALAANGDMERARTAADAFRKKYPASPFLPAVESRLSPP